MTDRRKGITDVGPGNPGPTPAARTMRRHGVRFHCPACGEESPVPDGTVIYPSPVSASLECECGTRWCVEVWEQEPDHD